MLAGLSKKYRLFILCNNASSVLVKKILDEEGIASYFGGVFVSAELGVRKPHKQFLGLVLGKIKEGKENCVMIGDRLNQDIRMANDAGIPSIHITLREHEDNKGEKGKFDYSVRSIKELERLLLK